MPSLTLAHSGHINKSVPAEFVTFTTKQQSYNVSVNSTMKLKKLCVLIFLVSSFPSEITCIANYNHKENLISEDDRRAAETHVKTDRFTSESSKRDLYGVSSVRHQTYPTGYGDGGSFSSPSYSYGVVPSHYSTLTYGSNYPSYGHTAPSSHGGGYGSVQEHGYSSHTALALKGLLIPLAGIALLGAAAALSTNPVLLQLGVVNGRRRRRRSFVDVYPNNLLTKPHK